jgi:hypothetical protein
MSERDPVAVGIDAMVPLAWDRVSPTCQVLRRSDAASGDSYSLSRLLS